MAALAWLSVAPWQPRERRLRAGERADEDAPSAVDGSGGTTSVHGGGAPTAPAVASDEPARDPACAPQQSTRCHQGDVYWVDGCGALEGKAEECEARLCKNGACAQRDPVACVGLPPEGVCDGEVVRGCLGGVPFARDCAALGKQCVVGDEGAVCRAPPDDACARAGALPRCDGNTLVYCEEGRVLEQRCGAFDARCEAARAHVPAACVAVTRLRSAPSPNAPCGPCGCDEDGPGGARAYADESCNGIDDDGDRFIDEDVRCEPVPIAAFVIADATGASSYARVDVEQEIARINEVFARNEQALRTEVVLASVTTLSEPDYLTLDERELDVLADELAAQLRASGVAGLAVPLVLTDEVLVEDAPKAGVSSLPNGHCGGLRVSRSPQPTHGIVALAKARSTTTAAHELGHFLGLCHTHESGERVLRRVARWQSSDGRGYEQACDPQCTQEGDGICDTPHDPGPPECDYDVQCSTYCPSGAEPDPSNVMSYYTACRGQLSGLQSVQLRKSRVLLEGFARCASPVDCPCALPGLVELPQGVASVACPEQMSCRPVADGLAACTLDGPLAQGEACRSQLECGEDLVCLQGRCAPPY